MNPSKIDDFLIFILFFLGLVLIFILVYIFIERKKKQNIKTRFRKFSENYQISGKDLRDASRVTVTDSLGITLSFTLTDQVRYESMVENISLSGFAVKPDSSIKKLPAGIEILNAKIKSPTLIYNINRLKIVRIDHQLSQRLMALNIVDINSDGFSSHKQLLSYLKKFLNES